ncbi:hypothetical protein PR048_026353 [Dryococelus australis]|uniref:Uncharacterized protein n=1 Tax=Dryococelus australis TaxID=614101 RepID=A0ABQ9GL53_9NEOP|nr:hypothetical protein PR048_026353 [Dryococelus australis]
MWCLPQSHIRCDDGAACAAMPNVTNHHCLQFIGECSTRAVHHDGGIQGPTGPSTERPPSLTLPSYGAGQLLQFSSQPWVSGGVNTNSICPVSPRPQPIIYSPIKSVTHSLLCWGCGGVVVRLLASHQGDPALILCGIAPGFSHVGILQDDASGRGVFLGISHFPHTCIPTLLHRFTLIGSQDLNVKSCPNLFTHSHPTYCYCSIQKNKQKIRGLRWSVSGHPPFVTLEKDPLFQHSSVSLSLDKQRHKTTQQMYQILKYDFLSQGQGLDERAKAAAIGVCLIFYDPSLAVKTGLSFDLFKQTIINLGTERHSNFVKENSEGKIAGCFALTEVSHGSNAKGMMTMATYNPATQQFNLHSSNFESAKCWVGCLVSPANLVPQTTRPQQVYCQHSMPPLSSLAQVTDESVAAGQRTKLTIDEEEKSRNEEGHWGCKFPKSIKAEKYARRKTEEDEKPPVTHEQESHRKLITSPSHGITEEKIKTKLNQWRVVTRSRMDTAELRRIVKTHDLVNERVERSNCTLVTCVMNGGNTAGLGTANATLAKSQRKLIFQSLSTN